MGKFEVSDSGSESLDGFIVSDEEASEFEESNGGSNESKDQLSDDGVIPISSGNDENSEESDAEAESEDDNQCPRNHFLCVLCSDINGKATYAHEDSFSAKQARFGTDKDRYCLVHTAGDQRKYILKLNRIAHNPKIKRLARDESNISWMKIESETEKKTEKAKNKTSLGQRQRRANRRKNEADEEAALVAYDDEVIHLDSSSEEARSNRRHSLANEIAELGSDGDDPEVDIVALSTPKKVRIEDSLRSTQETPRARKRLRKMDSEEDENSLTVTEKNFNLTEIPQSPITPKRRRLRKRDE
uniref:Uncharacterized protein n=1 Tax=Timspurckia oligopyrenoides TaxID=708627 RepID=A0A7S0ZBP9_9RHOD